MPKYDPTDHPHGPQPGESDDEYFARHAERLHRLGDAFRQGTADSQQELAFANARRAPRQTLLRALPALNVSHARRARIAECASKLWIFRSSSGQFATRANNCGSRWCPYCAKGRTRRVTQAIMSLMPKAKYRLLFCTLTQPQIPGEPLRDTVKRLRKSFRSLRALPLWNAIHAGFYVIEITESKSFTRTYHVHVHAVLDAKFIEYQDLFQAWHHVSGAQNCTITTCKEREWVDNYLTKYLTKPLPASFYEFPELLAEGINATKGTRLVAGLGAWRGLKIRETVEKSFKAAASRIYNFTWTYVGEVHALMDSALKGNPHDYKLLVECGFGPTVRWVPSLFDPQPDHARPPPAPLLTTAHPG